MPKRYTLLAILLFSVLGAIATAPRAWAQVSIADSAISLGMLSVGYNGYFPGGDLARRFGLQHSFGGDIGFKHRSNFYVTLGAAYLFGENVKEQNMLDGLAFFHVWNTTDGTQYVNYGFVDENGNTHQPVFTERGLLASVRFGKVFPALAIGKRANPNSGFFLEGGLQFLHHKIHIKFPSEALPLAKPDYLAGYDRLTNGFGPTLSAGYRFFGNRRYVCFMIALDAGLHFTRNRRGFNWDTNQYDTAVRHDALLGIRAHWVVPFYRLAPEGYYYY